MFPGDLLIIRQATEVHFNLVGEMFDLAEWIRTGETRGRKLGRLRRSVIGWNRPEGDRHDAPKRPFQPLMGNRTGDKCAQMPMSKEVSPTTALLTFKSRVTTQFPQEANAKAARPLSL